MSATEGVSRLRPKPRRLRGLRGVPYLVLGGAFLLSAALCLVNRSDRAWNQDESISFLEATCHLSEFEELIAARAAPYGQWTDVSQWRRLVQSEGGPCFARIHRDLATRDVHPPLYFWLLHGWVLAFGTGWGADIPLHLSLLGLGLLALYALGKQLFASRLDAAAATLIASLSPVAAHATMEFRPYALLGPVTALYLLTLVRCVECRGPVRLPRAAAVGAATAAGVLTHYLFLFVLLGGAMYALLRLRTAPGRPLRVGLASAAGLAIALLVFPVVAQIQENPGHLVPQNERLELRMGLVWDAFRRLLPNLSRGDNLLVACAVGALVLLAIRLRRRRLPRIAFQRTRGLYLLLAALVIPGAMIAQYSAGLTPTHAMGAKYLGALWPLVGLLGATCWRTLGAARWPAVIAVCVLFVLPSLERISARRDFLGAKLRAVHAPAVIIDNTSRLHLPRLIARIADDTRLLVADRATLLATDLELPGEFLYLSCAPGPDAKAQSRALLDRFAKTHKPKRRTRFGFCWTTHHLLERK